MDELSSDQLRAFSEAIAQLRRLLDFAARITKNISSYDVRSYDRNLREMQKDLAELADTMTVLALTRWDKLYASSKEKLLEDERERVKKKCG